MGKRRRRASPRNRRAGQPTRPRRVLATDLPPEVLEDWYVHVGEMLLARTRAIFDAPWTDLGKIEHG